MSRSCVSVLCNPHAHYWRPAIVDGTRYLIHRRWSPQTSSLIYSVFVATAGEHWTVVVHPEEGALGKVGSERLPPSICWDRTVPNAPTLTSAQLAADNEAREAFRAQAIALQERVLWSAVPELDGCPVHPVYHHLEVVLH